LLLIPIALHAGEVTFREGLCLPSAARYGREPVPTDAIAAQLVAGTWQAPKAGDTLTAPEGGKRMWEVLKPDDKGVFAGRALNGGYLFFSFESDSDRVLMLEAAGHAAAYVNGQLRAGDVYSYGYVQLPVVVKKGTNELLVHVARGRLQIKLTEPKAPLFLSPLDATTPDLIAGQAFQGWAGVLAVNATTQTQGGLSVNAGGAVTPLPALPPCSVTKVPIRFSAPATNSGEKFDIQLELKRSGDTPQDLGKEKLTLNVVKPDALQKRTFRSAIDGSVQYFALVPAHPGYQDPVPGLILTLHGAAVEARGQAACFAPKHWAHVVAPTNRRPFGFDWEDWGRFDALEVLDEAMKQLKPDPQRLFLTGHSMGGHGTWHVGVTFPDRFAAIGPSAGWVSMASYAGQRKPQSTDPVAEMMHRAASPGDTLSLLRNVDALGVFVLHGDKDDNVPVSQARTMRTALAEFHRDWVYYERPGAGHWWGNDCVDWLPMMDFFERHRLPEPGQVRQVDFTTASPAVSATCHWATIKSQLKAFCLSSVHINHDPDKRSFTGKTGNVAGLAFDLSHLSPGKPVVVELDGEKLGELPWPASGAVLHLARGGEKWAVANASSVNKNPRRGGPFRDVFCNRVMFVYGTKGSPGEYAWALQKARFDAETFWYRGNGGIEIVPDSAFDPDRERDRNVVLYGNADSNAAWHALLGDGPVRVSAGLVKVGKRELHGDDLACLFVRPRPGSDCACVGVVAGSGLKGMRTADRLPYFTSGVGYPDLFVLSADSLTKGVAGVRLAGFFGNDWSVEKGEWAGKD
jgi:pimeloyl-ACP methyl ester carboxylesterase